MLACPTGFELAFTVKSQSSSPDHWGINSKLKPQGRALDLWNISPHYMPAYSVLGLGPRSKPLY